MDLMVLEVQQWLNTGYGGKSGYKLITEDGITGGATEAALITALQIELGIPSPDGVFGPATKIACPTLSTTSTSKNEIYILQGGLYCKGYNPNGFDGGYGNGVKTAIETFQTDAGLTTKDGITTPMIFQALLNTDSFVLATGGDANIRIIQQALNKSYNSVIGLIPSNGLYASSTNVALIYALQVEEGNASPDGFWGPTTASLCPVLSSGSTKTKFILILQYALYCNHYNPNGFDGGYGNGVTTAVTDFQKFVCLTANGVAGMPTWASLLVSTGDSSRIGTSGDCSKTITTEIAATLKANGHTLIGRYLTEKFAMTSDELETIFANGLNVFPIFENGNTLSYFSEEQGTEDAINALLAASELGFNNVIIYFAVDFDALTSDVTTNIIPYFQAINNEFSNNQYAYRVGIYAPRNVCSRVAAAGYSVSSFVCDMSTGFSGNIGYTLPTNWAFDQISTATLGSGLGTVPTDNDICSGKNLGVNSVNSPTAALVTLASEIGLLFNIPVVFLNQVSPALILPNGMQITMEVGFKTDIGTGDLSFTVKDGEIQGFDAIAGVISASTGLSGDWFNELGTTIDNGSIKFAIKSNLSFEIEIDQQIPDTIPVSSPYLYTLINISIGNYVNGLGTDIIQAITTVDPAVFEMAALIMTICALDSVPILAVDIIAFLASLALVFV